MTVEPLTEAEIEAKIAEIDDMLSKRVTGNLLVTEEFGGGAMSKRATSVESVEQLEKLRDYWLERLRLVRDSTNNRTRTRRSIARIHRPRR